MSENRLSAEYSEGVDHFLDFCQKYAKNLKLVLCPCLKCGNIERMDITRIKEHLFRNEMEKNRVPGEQGTSKSNKVKGFYIMERGGDNEWSAWLDYGGDDGPSVPEGSSVDPKQPSMEEGSGDPEQPTQKNVRGRSKQNDITKMLEVEYNNYGINWGKGATAKVTRIGAWVGTNIPL
ncbi:hypothetical protein F8388_017693 [Cannabis sativa]|uniref:Transposase-associated domain-containing protein n=1 Tax=Cannabis sativa TaxID=3483 RepID=A0A7J6HIV6_CANSA|nr:hypothetical protein F8388_017693 [Cannabis sativa]